MRYWVYDDENVLMRKFNTKYEADSFVQAGWRVVVQPKIIKPKPNTNTHGEARW